MQSVWSSRWGSRQIEHLGSVHDADEIAHQRGEVFRALVLARIIEPISKVDSLGRWPRSGLRCRPTRRSSVACLASEPLWRKEIKDGVRCAGRGVCASPQRSAELTRAARSRRRARPRSSPHVGLTTLDLRG